MSDRRLLWVWLAILAVWAGTSLPLGSGRQTLIARDVFTTHLHLKFFGAAQLRAGKIPALDPDWGLGEPFRGNPNALAFYPGNILYLVLPFWSAFNLHYVLHWLLAFLAMRALARELGQGEAAAFLAALTYAGGGWILSALTFYNILTVAAWWPLVLWGAARGGRRGIAVGGVACGLALLGGEPVTAALGLAPLLLVAVRGHGAKLGWGTTLAIGALGLAIALPQVVATARVLPFTFRGAHGLLPAAEPDAYALQLVRLLELVVPLPFGWPWDFGRFGFWARPFIPLIPYVLTLYCGMVGLWLACAGALHRRRWAALGGAGLLCAWLGGIVPGGLGGLSAGLVRYPEKFLFWFALALPLLAGWGLERVLEQPRRWARVATVGAAITGVLALGGFVLGPRLADWMARFTHPERSAGAPATQTALWLLALAAAALLLGCAAWAARRRSASWLIALQLLGLLQLFPLLATDDVDFYHAPPPWASRLGAEARVLSAVQDSILGGVRPLYRMDDGAARAGRRLEALDLDAVLGPQWGLTYPLAHDLEGMNSPYLDLLLYNLPRLSWPHRVRWMQVLGVEALVVSEAISTAGLERIDQVERSGLTTYLYRVAGPAPPVWWPRELVAAPSPVEALRAVSRFPSATIQAAVPRALPHDPAGSVSRIEDTPDRIVLETRGRGGVAVVERAYQTLFTARTAAGAPVELVPVDLWLLGVVAPPGEQRITIEISALPETIAGGVALVALAAALGSLVLRGREGQRRDA